VEQAFVSKNASPPDSSVSPSQRILPVKFLRVAVIILLSGPGIRRTPVLLAVFNLRAGI